MLLTIAPHPSSLRVSFELEPGSFRPWESRQGVRPEQYWDSGRLCKKGSYHDDLCVPLARSAVLASERTP